MKNFYITTTTPYVNADPHIGFALEIVAADVIARYHRDLLKEEVTFNTGTDEHGQKIYQQAKQANLDPQDYVDSFAPKYQALKSLLNLSFDRFIRTTNPEHKKAAQEFWKLCDKAGDIYKKLYPVKYCIGCELEKTDSELEEGRCPLHPNREIEIREEENYFFRFSKYQKPLLDFYKNNPDFVRPQAKFNEINSFVAGGLQDFSISRQKSKMPWGVPVPDDSGHVMYVWFDALINYISTLGWPSDNQAFKKFWPGTQIAGKDNLRQQSAMWQAMLLSAGLKPSKQILINGFISVDGQKMSKSLGNVISPQELVDRYGIDGARYLLIKLGPVSGDMDVSWEKFDQTYTADLSNGLGNLVSRIATLAEKNQTTVSDTSAPSQNSTSYQNHFKNYQFGVMFDNIWRNIKKLDKSIEADKPWALDSTQANAKIQNYIGDLKNITSALIPFLPETAEKISSHFKGPKITAIKPLFPRLEK